jgi:hypothetical protein
MYKVKNSRTLTRHRRKEDLGQDAKRCANSGIPTRHPHPSTPYGAVVCAGNEIWIQAGAVAKTVACSDSGISHIRHTKHPGTFAGRERLRVGERILIILCSQTIVRFTFFVLVGIAKLKLFR